MQAKHIEKTNVKVVINIFNLVTTKVKTNATK